MEYDRGCNERAFLPAYYDPAVQGTQNSDASRGACQSYHQAATAIDADRIGLRDDRKCFRCRDRGEPQNAGRRLVARQALGRAGDEGSCVTIPKTCRQATHGPGGAEPWEAWMSRMCARTLAPWLHRHE